jgi:hypothetical protein
LVAAYSWLGFCWLRAGCRYHLISLSLLGAATISGATLLYAPLLLVSGPAALFQNVYVKPQAVGAFFQGLPAYWWELEGGLLGESHNGVLATLHLGSLAVVAVLIGFLALVSAARNGRLPAHEAAYSLRLDSLASPRHQYHPHAFRDEQACGGLANSTRSASNKGYFAR